MKYMPLNKIPMSSVLSAFKYVSMLRMKKEFLMEINQLLSLTDISLTH